MHHFKRNSCTRQNGTRIIIALRINNGHALRNQIGWFMMIGDNNINSSIKKQRYFPLRCYAIINRNNQIWIIRSNTFNRSIRESISFFKAKRDKRGYHRSPTSTKSARHEGGCRNPIEIEVAIHKNMIFVLYSLSNSIDCGIHAFYQIRITPNALKIGI